MRQLPERKSNCNCKTYGFYIVAVVILAAVWLIQGPMNVPPAPSNTLTPLGDATEWDKLAVPAASDTIRLLATLATALLGALGLLLVNRGDNRPKPGHLWQAFLCAMSAGVSLFFGYVSHLHLLYLIDCKSFDPTIPFMKWPTHFQFYTLLLGAFFLANFALLDLSEED